MSTEELILLPDAVFIYHCYSEYKLSNNAFSEIDLFFCRYGIEKRTERRRHLLAFLEYGRIKQISNQTSLKKGRIILSQDIEEYLEESHVLLYMRETAI